MITIMITSIWDVALTENQSMTSFRKSFFYIPIKLLAKGTGQTLGRGHHYRTE